MQQGVIACVVWLHVVDWQGGDFRLAAVFPLVELVLVVPVGLG